MTKWVWVEQLSWLNLNKQRLLGTSPAKRHDFLKLELPRALEPSSSSISLQSETYKWMQSWNLLSLLNNRGSIPRLCLGDFNKVLSIEEMKGHAIKANRKFQKFWDIVDDWGFIDLGWEGYKSTWANNNIDQNLLQEGELIDVLLQRLGLTCFRQRECPI